MLYHRPNTLSTALAIRASRDVSVLAGGTDVYPAKAIDDAWGNRSVRNEVLDITLLKECLGIERQSGRTRIGSLVTWTDIVDADLPPWFNTLKLSAREVGGLQVQNRGTIGGNLCNASPAADGIPPLLILDASVELASQEGVRELTLKKFLTGYRSTACRREELVTAIYVPDCPRGARTHFMKLGAREYLVISVVMVAGLAAFDGDERIVDIRLSLGACSVVAQRLFGLEGMLIGETVETAASIINSADLEEIKPINDFRGTSTFRNDVALTMLRRLLNALRP